MMAGLGIAILNNLLLETAGEGSVLNGEHRLSFHYVSEEGAVAFNPHSKLFTLKYNGTYVNTECTKYSVQGKTIQEVRMILKDDATDLQSASLISGSC